MLHSKVKYIQSLSHKKQRDEDRVFVAEGPKIINELLHAPGIALVEVLAVKEWLNNYEGRPLSNFTEISEVTLSRMSNLKTPNQVIGVFKMCEPGTFDAAKGLSLLLDGIQDPGNMGTIVRCADWFGVSQVVCSEDCVDIYNPKTVQATMGSVARVNVYYNDLARIIAASKPVKTYAAALSGTAIDKVQPVSGGLLVIGNESKGISSELLQLCDEKITIPKMGGAESLNAAVAAGIILSRLKAAFP